MAQAMTKQRRHLWEILVVLLALPFTVMQFGGWGPAESTLWGVLLLAWLVSFAFTTKTGEPLPRHVRRIMFGILVLAGATAVILSVILHQGPQVTNRVTSTDSAAEIGTLP
jgi:hypothetical protein